jgi:PAS domain S-box-containing protein
MTVEEADELRRAIADGEVDAFVVGAERDRRVLLLAGAYHRYRELVERMQQGAVSANARGNILYANQRFCELIGAPLLQLYTRPLESFAIADDRPKLARFLANAAYGSQVEIGIERREGPPLPVRMSLASVVDDYAAILVTDLRPLRLQQRTVELLASIRKTLEGAGSEPAAAIDAALAQVAALEREAQDLG